MGRFYDLFYKNDVFYKSAAASEAVSPTTPPWSHSPSGYGSLMSIDFAACVQTKARSMASLPFSVVRETGGRRENLGDHPLAALMNGMANEEMPVTALMAWTVLRRDTFGNAYWWVEWRRGRPRAIWPVSAHVRHGFDPSRPEGYRTSYTVSPGDDHVPAGTYFSDEIVNIPTHITKDGVRGVSLASLSAEEIGLSVDLERFYSSMLRNGNHQLGHVEVPATRMTADDLKALRTAVDAKRGVGEAGKAPIFGYGAKWVTDQQTMKDASVIEQQRWVLQQVCRACNVPPWKVYDLDSATYASSQQQRIDYVTDTIVPDVRSVEIGLRPVIDACGISGCGGKFKIQGLMRGDDASRSQYYREMAYLGAYTRGDIRELEDMEPIDGIDLPLFPLNYGTVNQDGTVNVFNADGPSAPGDGSQEGASDV